MDLSKPKGEAIYLNVYSLGGWNCILNFFGIGVFHSGIEVYGVEYWYGGHEKNCSGIMRSQPGELGLKLEEQILVGFTLMSVGEVINDILFLDEIWVGSEYEPFSHNCNNFSKDVIWRLCQSDYFPAYINRFSIMKPFFKAWYAPLRYVLGDLVKVKKERSTTEEVTPKETKDPYKIKSVANSRDFLAVKEVADSYYMVNSYALALTGYIMCIAGKFYCEESYVLQHVYVSSANCCAKLGKYLEMDQYTTMCIVDFPDFVLAYVKRALAKKNLKDYQAAYEDLMKANRLAPDDALVLEELKRLTKTQRLVKIGSP